MDGTPDQHNPGDHSIEDGRSRPKFPVVGIGCSAGGLEALTAFFKTVRPDLNVAYVLVPHLDPHRNSAFAEILSRVTKIPVAEITEAVPLRPNRLYIIPPGFQLFVENAVLHLRVREAHTSGTIVIDNFLRSLAEDQGENAIGVVLSGMGADGAVGLAAIKAAGGITFAQTPETAHHQAMPSNAIASSQVDYVLAPDKIAEQLGVLRNHPYLEGSNLTALDAKLSSTLESNWHRIFELLLRATNVDFSEYKRATIERRIARRMALRHETALERYVAFLQDNKNEVHALYQDLLISVTNFFRDPAAFEELKTIAYPIILGASRSASHPVRIWVPGCSTGEEAYSHAINLMEYIEHNNQNVAIQVFGTDLSETAITKARLGVFKEVIENNVSKVRLQRFFHKTDSGYQINKRIRELCIFSQQSIFTDPPFSRLDLVSCRNLLIYLGRSLQKQVIPILHYALNPEGFLVIGNSEGLLGAGSELFELIDRKQKIYRKRVVATPMNFGFKARATMAPTHESENLVNEPKHLPVTIPADLQRESDRLLLTRYAPPSVVVDENLEVIQIKGHTSDFLELPSGKVDLNVLKMVRTGLLHELQAAIEEARSAGVEADRRGVFLSDRVGALRLRVVPFKTPIHQKMNFLIVFESEDSGVAAEGSSTPNPMTIEERQLNQREITQLKQELGATKEYLQAIIESEQATNEELQSANEEIQAGNEELQSTNEELQTSKEELESANEELHTVNEEMQHRNEALAQVNNDLTNLLNSVGLPVVMVGSDLSVRRFTPQAGQLLGLLGSDVGRPIQRLKLRLELDGLEKLMLDVLATFETKQTRLKDPEGNSYPVRLTPYRTLDNRIDGVVLTLFTIDRSFIQPE